MMAASLEESVKSLQDRIAALEEENNLLKNAKQKHLPFHEDKEDSETHKTIESLQQQVAILRDLSPFRFSGLSEVLSQDGLTVNIRKTIEGRYRDVQFQLKFLMQESLDTGESHVTDLSIAASDVFTTDLIEHIERMSAQGNVQGFLHLVKGYSRWTEAKTQTFKHFTAEYPNIVMQVDTNLLNIKANNCTLVLTWNLEVEGESSVVPDIRLEVVVPESVQEKQKDFLESVDENFQLMLQRLGIEASINSLIETVK
ncbi:centromere protein P-like isoform X1 [Dreissena polymorpha]|uniref:centromere protein P-like isoform X1 n=1 Tax=Dreissena polymorpha TaxID=45954 RepID=UPI002264784B|nr:centromere protein P-like isoform X1 [Dreissena polymorpha]XP_052284049.1 centromere protein P-like isoform X1 [Dreissena polymorpha]XP_052284051.1 centromere protein P-like isoform X1 [Dreissena polymorpha]